MDGLLTHQQIRSIAASHNVPYQTIEKDYALTELLLTVSKFPKLNKMVFKGGTSLKKIHFANFRFSEDLDFTCYEDISEDLVNFLLNNIDSMNFNFTKIKNIESKKVGTTFRIMYKQTDKLESSIRFDLSMRGDVFLKTVSKPVMSIYEQFPNNIILHTMDIEEIMAEKVRAVVYSKHVRHLYDIYFMNLNGININSDLVRKKYETIYKEEFDISKIDSRITEKKERWIQELKPFVIDKIPPFDDVASHVSKLISNAMT